MILPSFMEAFGGKFVGGRLGGLPAAAASNGALTVVPPERGSTRVRLDLPLVGA